MQGKILGIPLTVIVLWLAIITPVVALELVILKEVRGTEPEAVPAVGRQIATPANSPAPIATESATPTKTVKYRVVVPSVVQSVTP